MAMLSNVSVKRNGALAQALRRSMLSSVNTGHPITVHGRRLP